MEKRVKREAAAFDQPTFWTAPGLDVNELFAPIPTLPAPARPAYQSSVDDFIDAIGCLLGIALSENQVGWLRLIATAALSGSGAQDQAESIRWIVQAFQEIKHGDSQARQNWRQLNQPAFLQWIRQNTRYLLACMLQGWYDEAQKILAPGSPPLTRAAAESCIELADFIVLVFQGKEPGAAAPKNLDALIAGVARDHPSKSPQQQAWTAASPITLYELRRSWPSLSPDQRDEVRHQLAAQLGVQTRRDPAPGHSTPMAAVAAAQNTAEPDWHARFGPAPGSLNDLQREWSEAQSSGDFQKAAELQLKIQNQLQQQTQAANMLSNIASMTHGMRKAVVNNLKS
jgi:hypothetical protein